MSRLTRRISDRVGLPPGALVYTGDRRDDEVKVNSIEYDEATIEEKTAETFQDCLLLKGKPTVTWISIIGIHRVENLERLGNCFKIHHLILEDILSTEHRPKVEDLDDYVYMLLKMLRYDNEKNEVAIEQVSLILGQNFVLSFQDRESELFRPILDRLRNGQGRLRRMGADYLAYALMDTIIDNYFIVLEKIGERIETLEEQLISVPTPDTLHAIHRMRREMILLRRVVWPLREVLANLERGESDLIKDTTTMYLRDLYDHIIQVIDTIETLRDMLTGMLDLYLSSVNNRLNAVMKVLTIIATIFMPLTFIAGIYGMNFRYMPELEWVWGYPAALLFMLSVALFMLFGFRAKRWV